MCGVVSRISYLIVTKVRPESRGDVAARRKLGVIRLVQTVLLAGDVYVPVIWSDCRR